MKLLILFILIITSIFSFSEEKYSNLIRGRIVISEQIYGDDKNSVCPYYQEYLYDRSVKGDKERSLKSFCLELSSQFKKEKREFATDIKCNSFTGGDLDFRIQCKKYL